MWTRISYFSRETLVSLRRNVLMTIAGIVTVAVSLVAVRRHPDAVEVGRPRHRAHQGRRDARDLHEGQGDRPADQGACRTQLDADKGATGNVKSYRHLDQGRRVRRSSSASSGATPTSSNSIRRAGPPRVVPGRAEEGGAHRDGEERVRDRSRASTSVEHARRGAQGPDRRHQHRAVDLHGDLAGAAGVVAVPHREHDPPRHVRPSPRDRGDEARGRVELVRAHPVHRRGHGAGPRGRRARDHRGGLAQALRLRPGVQRPQQLLQRVLRHHRRRHLDRLPGARSSASSSASSAPASASAASCAPDDLRT